MIFGLDYLAGCRYWKRAIRFHPAGFAAGAFIDKSIFGKDGWSFLSKIIDTGKCPLVRGQLLWDDDHKYGSKEDIKKIIQLSREGEIIAKTSPGVVVEISPFTEHNLSNPDKYLDICQNEAPSCVIVNNPWKGAFSKNYKNEVHGKHSIPSGAYNVSADGGFEYMSGKSCELVDIDVESWKEKHKRAKVLFFWCAEFNLKWHIQNDTTPRPKRVVKPKKQDIEGQAFLANKKGNTNLPKGWICKSHADRHGKNDPKGNKLLMICPHKAKNNKIILRAGGKRVGMLKYFGTYVGGGYRYYGSKYGYQYAEKAMQRTGSFICEVVMDGQVYGKVNPGFRENAYRTKP